MMGAMSGYAVSYLSGSPWLGVLTAGAVGIAMGLLHGTICSLNRVNDIAVGIALMLFGVGLADYLGKPFIQPAAPQLRLDQHHFGWWSSSSDIQNALKINELFLIGVTCDAGLLWAFRATRWGLVLRIVGESADAARALGYRVIPVRILATCAGGFLAGIGGSFLSLYYPGAWSERISSGQGIVAVALVIFARWNPKLCFWRCGACCSAALAARPLVIAIGRGPVADTTCSTLRPTS